MRSLRPGRRVGERALLDQDLDRELDVGDREHRALGRPGRARGVDQRGQVVGPLARRAPRRARRGAARGASRPSSRKSAQDEQLLVVVAVPDAARLEVDDALQVRALVEDRERLVDLLLVLGDEDLGAGVAEQVADLGGRVGRVDADRRGPHGERAHVGDQPLGPVLGVDRDPVAGLDAERQERVPGELDLVPVLRPGPLPPDAEVLVAQRDRVAASARRASRIRVTGLRHARQPPTSWPR